MNKTQKTSYKKIFLLMEEEKKLGATGLMLLKAAELIVKTVKF